MSKQIENYLEKAEYLKAKLSKLKNNSNNNQEKNKNINPNIRTIGNIMNYSSSSESLLSPNAQWERDENAPICNDCKSKFSLFNRRHHCR